MLPGDHEPAKETKGARTARRIMDVAEDLFATQGYDGTSLRQIAEGAAIKEPGLYNHFGSKQALYEAVLFRALNPMAEALAQHMEGASRLRDYTELPSIMTDLLFEHPQMAGLFQQAMQGDSTSIGNQLVGDWLAKLFNQGMQSLEDIGAPGLGAPISGQASSENPNGQDRAALAINLIAMFNLTTGYFLSQRAFASLTEGQLLDPDNIAKQKRLLHKVIRAMLIS
jgi:AcrR family transcriptional regulator